MISFIEGVVDSAGPLEVVLNVGGVGYRIEVPVTTAERVPGPRQSVRLHIHPVYREDSHALYGFASADERDFFRLLLHKVSGIGPKTALNLMSRLAFPLLREAIARADSVLLAKCPGIGKKTAERLCVELKDQLATTLNGGTGGQGAGAMVAAQSSGMGPIVSGGSNEVADAIEALVALGYKMDAADAAVRKAVAQLGAEAPANALVKAALAR